LKIYYEKLKRTLEYNAPEEEGIIRKLVYLLTALLVASIFSSSISLVKGDVVGGKYSVSVSPSVVAANSDTVFTLVITNDGLSTIKIDRINIDLVNDWLIGSHSAVRSYSRTGMIESSDYDTYWEEIINSNGTVTLTPAFDDVLKLCPGESFTICTYPISVVAGTHVWSVEVSGANNEEFDLVGNQPIITTSFFVLPEYSFGALIALSTSVVAGICFHFKGRLTTTCE
jgi:hypothetical protein